MSEHNSVTSEHEFSLVLSFLNCIFEIPVLFVYFNKSFVLLNLSTRFRKPANAQIRTATLWQN